MPKFILASASPRRKELLKLICDKFEILPSNIQEDIPENTEAFNVPEYLAKIKGEEIAKLYNDDIVISADTAVIFKDEILGKPKNELEAFKMLSLLSGNTHYVITGCAIFYKGRCDAFSIITEVDFYELSDEDIIDYIKTNESFDKAGGYGIQSKGSLLVKGIRGDYYNVVGLPIAELNRRIINILK